MDSANQMEQRIPLFSSRVKKHLRTGADAESIAYTAAGTLYTIRPIRCVRL